MLRHLYIKVTFRQNGGRLVCYFSQSTWCQASLLPTNLNVNYKYISTIQYFMYPYHTIQSKYKTSEKFAETVPDMLFVIVFPCNNFLLGRNGRKIERKTNSSEIWQSTLIKCIIAKEEHPSVPRQVLVN